MPPRTDRLAAAQSSLRDSAEQLPPPSPARPPVTNVTHLGQQLAPALGAAHALVDQVQRYPEGLVQELRGWYYRQHPSERARLLWQRFVDAAQTCRRLESAIRVARQALDADRAALVQADAERAALASHPLPATVGEEAAGARAEAVQRYQTVRIECQQRKDALTELERLLPTPEQSLPDLIRATAHVLEAVVTIEREVFVRHLRESGELERLRGRFERLRTMANMHDAEMAEWSQRAGRHLRVPRVAFPWPPASVWTALLDASAEGPGLVWNEDPKGSRP